MLSRLCFRQRRCLFYTLSFYPKQSSQNKTWMTTVARTEKHSIEEPAFIWGISKFEGHEGALPSGCRWTGPPALGCTPVLLVTASSVPVVVYSGWPRYFCIALRCDTTATISQTGCRSTHPKCLSARIHHTTSGFKCLIWYWLPLCAATDHIHERGSWAPEGHQSSWLAGFPQPPLNSNRAELLPHTEVFSGEVWHSSETLGLVWNKWVTLCLMPPHNEVLV